MQENDLCDNPSNAGVNPAKKWINPTNEGLLKAKEIVRSRAGLGCLSRHFCAAGIKLRHESTCD